MDIDFLLSRLNPWVHSYDYLTTKKVDTMHLIDKGTLYGHGGMVTSIDIGTAKISREKFEGKYFIISGCTAGEILIHLLESQRKVAGNTIKDPVQRVAWLYQRRIGKFGISRSEYMKEENTVPFIEDIEIAVQYKTRGLIFYGVIQKFACENQDTYALIPRMRIENISHNFCKMQTCYFKSPAHAEACSGKYQALFIPVNSHSIRCIFPTSSKKLTDPEGRNGLEALPQFTVDLSVPSKGPKLGELMTIFPFKAFVESELQPWGHFHLVTGHEDGRVIFWQVIATIDNMSLSHAEDQTARFSSNIKNQVLQEQTFIISEKPLSSISGSSQVKEVSTEVLIAVGTLDGVVIIFRRNQNAKFSVFKASKVSISDHVRRPSFVTENAVAITDICFTLDSKELIILSSDAKIRLLDLRHDGRLREIFSFPSMGIAKGLTKSTGLLCITAVACNECSFQDFGAQEEAHTRGLLECVGDREKKLKESGFSRSYPSKDMLFVKHKRSELLAVGGSQGQISLLGSVQTVE